MSGSKDKGPVDEPNFPPDMKLWREALVGEMRRMLRRELEPINDRLDKVESAQTEQPRRPQFRRGNDDYYGNDFVSDEESVGSRRRNERVLPLHWQGSYQRALRRVFPDVAWFHLSGLRSQSCDSELVVYLGLAGFQCPWAWWMLYSNSDAP